MCLALTWRIIPSTLRLLTVKQSSTIPRRSQMNTNDKFDVLEDAETVETVEKADTVELSLSDLDVVSGGGGVIVAFG